MRHWNAEEAKQLRDSGMTWNAIGDCFGVSGVTVHRRLNPDRANHMRESASRRRRSERIMAVITQEPEGAVFETSVGPAYRVYRDAAHGLGVVRTAITLPFVSILGEGTV